ncbi:MAG: DUF4397 domain-containing protein [Sphingobacteriia bacterium]|nr:DUF4397 domain-containing protein [Sphingobacteriia bacterium]
MKNLFYYITCIVIGLSACTKTTTSNSEGSTSGNTFLNVTRIDSNAKTNIVVTPSNGNLFITLGGLYTCGYMSFASGLTTIKVQSQLSGQVYQSSGYILYDDNRNTAFIYPYGNYYRASVVTEDFDIPATGYAHVRVLDFSARNVSATYNFSISNSANNYSFNDRYFLDHELNSDLTKFTNVVAGSYVLYATRGNSVLINPYAFNLLSGKIYTIVVTDISNTNLASFSMPHI